MPKSDGEILETDEADKMVKAYEKVAGKAKEQAVQK